MCGTHMMAVLHLLHILVVLHTFTMLHMLRRVVLLPSMPPGRGRPLLHML
jgi:hypothetical protein